MQIFYRSNLKPKHWIAFILLGIIWSSSFLWIKIRRAERKRNCLFSKSALAARLENVGHLRHPRPDQSRHSHLLHIMGRANH
jgi:hypothetical protein